MNTTNSILRRYPYFLTTILLLILPYGQSLIAQTNQDTTTVWVIKMEDGNQLSGRILKKDAKMIFFKTENLGTLALKRKDIKSRKVYEPEYDGDKVNPWKRSKIYSRYMLVPNGMLQKKGESYYENKYVFINHVNVALSDCFSLGLGMMPLFLLEDVGTPVWIVPKLRIPTKHKKLHFATGFFYGNILFDEYSEGSIFIPYFAGTYGDQNWSFSLSIGYGNFVDSWMEAPTFSYSGTMRLSRKSFAFVENIVITTKDYDDNRNKLLMFSMGLRTIWQKVSLDFGLISIKDTEGYIYSSDTDVGVLPYVGLLVPFR